MSYMPFLCNLFSSYFWSSSSFSHSLHNRYPHPKCYLCYQSNKYILPYVSPCSYTLKHMCTKHIHIDRGAFLVLVYECGIILEIISCILPIIVVISTCHAEEHPLAQVLWYFLILLSNQCLLSHYCFHLHSPHLFVILNFFSYLIFVIWTSLVC